MDTHTDPDRWTAQWTARWTAGPDRSVGTALPAGRHVVGRSGDIRSTSATIAAHHVVIDLGEDGAIRVLPLAAGAMVRLGEGCHLIEVGDAVLELRHASAAPAPAAELPLPAADGATVLADGTLIRRPRVVPTWEEPTLVVPQPPVEPERGGGGLTPALIGLAGSGAIAALLHQPMFILFGAMGALVAVGSWIAQRVAARRSTRRSDREYRLALEAHQVAVAQVAEARARFVRARVPTIQGAMSTASPAPTAVLWSRRPDHGDAFVVGVGVHPTTGLPVPTDLGPSARLAVHGPGATEVAMGLLAQLATSVGPADVRIVVVSDRPERWSALRGLPHLLVGASGVTVAEGEVAEVLHDGDDRHTVMVTDHLTALATRTGMLRRSLQDRTALLAVAGPDDAVPQLCQGVLHLRTAACDGEQTGEWTGDTRSPEAPVPVTVAAFTSTAMATVALALSTLRDPEDETASRLPDSVTAEEIDHGCDPTTIVERWAAGPHTPRAAIGIAEDGIVDIDLVRDGPHALLAGTTGSGKSELLRTLVVGLAAAAPPDALQLVLVDYKGGATFDGLDRLPHVAAVVTDLDEHLADRALRSLHAELRRRERTVRDAGVADVAQLRRDGTDPVPPRLVVIVDEFAALVAEQPAFLHALVGVAQRGRSLGVHLLLATQRPAGVISDDIRANTNLRIALRLHDAADANDVVGDRLPATFPRRLPGRGVVRLGPDELVVFQTARLADPDGAVDAICAAAARLGSPRLDPPWPAPLPDELHGDEVPDGAIGWCDDPDRQRRVPLEWKGGSLLVVGSPGSGVSSTLRTVLGRALSEPLTHAYVLTADPNGWVRTVPHPRAAVVAVQETDRVLQLLHRVTTREEARRTVLIVDGVDAVRRALDDPATAATLDTLDRALADPALVVVAGSSHPSRIPSGLVARCAQRWVLHLHDAADASAIGVAARDVPLRLAGRAWIHELGLTAQVVRPRPLTLVGGRRRADRAAMVPLEGVPAHLDPRTLPPARHEDGDLVLPLGREVHRGDADGLVVPDGDHVLVLGGPRTGRSSTLTAIVTAWRAANPNGSVVALLPRRSTFARSLATTVHRDADHTAQAIAELGATARPCPPHPVLLVVDDADTVDDERGNLAALVGRRDGSVMAVAAARGDALRHRYGHWTTALRSSRTGLIATADAAEDGDLLGVVLPRRSPLAARPGLMWASDHRGTRLMQVVAPGSRPSPARALASAR